MIKSFYIVAFTLFFTNCPAQKKCDGILNKLEYLECREKEYKQLDSLLSSHFEEIFNEISPLDQECILSSQKIWKEYRENYCECYSAILKGNQSQRNYYDCLIDITKRRQEELKELQNINK